MPGSHVRLPLLFLAASIATAEDPVVPTPPPPPAASSQAAPPPPAPAPDPERRDRNGAERPAEDPPEERKTPAAGPAATTPGAKPPGDDAPEAEAPPPAEQPRGDLYDFGQHLFETFAPEEIKEQYRFPTREEWDEFALRLDRALQSSSLERLAAMEPDARAALMALRALPDYSEYADWLEERLDDIAIARLAADAPPAKPPAQRSDPAKPRDSAASAVPLYDLWLERMRQRPPPSRAAKLVPRLKPAFDRAEVPSALVWVAEVESSFNPAARSPVGARGLFQLMPGTARDLGLRLFPFDERLDPMKNATSAARYLHQLHRRFQDWPLALAAYNAGPARVSRTLQEHQATTFAQIAEELPAETRLYVPKVLATITVREGVALAVSKAAGVGGRFLVASADEPDFLRAWDSSIASSANRPSPPPPLRPR